jgi:hypothetical protein
MIQFICGIAAALDDFVHKIGAIASDRSFVSATFFIHNLSLIL